MVFQKAIERAVPAEDVSTRVVNLIDCITYSVFMYTSRGLFERDKLIFSTQMAFQASCFTLKNNNTFTYLYICLHQVSHCHSGCVNYLILFKIKFHRHST